MYNYDGRGDAERAPTLTRIAGIVCEYNPFHEGHQYQIDTLRREYGAEAVVCVMSGHFMQRGEPAVVGKDRRGMMALAGGADLVVELPALYATRSAYWFALGGVCLLAAAGATHIAFGAETDALADLQATAARLARPDSLYTDSLRRYLSAGLSFAEAQAKALNCGDSYSFVPALPNDRLALSYLQVVAENNLPLTPILIPREGSAYHETVLQAAEGRLASASAIRRRLAEGADLYGARELSTAQLRSIGVARHIPAAALPWLANTRLVFSRDAASVQLALLRRASPDTLRTLPDMTEGLEHRVWRAAAHAGSLEEFYSLLKTRRYTLTRLQRLVTHLLIDYREVHAAELAAGPPYLRVLGATAAGRQLLHRIKKETAIPVVTRTSQIKALARQDAHAANTWEVELRASALYGLLAGSDFSKGNPEYFISSVMLP